MFAYQRKKVGLALALADIALVSLAFLIAYQTRVHIGLEREFFLTPKRLVVLLLVSLASWIAVAAYSRLYEHLDSAQWTRVIRSTFRQCAVASAFVVFFEYTARWDLSRSFLFLLFGYALVFLSVFRLNSEKIIRRFLLEFGSPYHVVLIGERREADCGHRSRQQQGHCGSAGGDHGRNIPRTDVVTPSYRACRQSLSPLLQGFVRRVVPSASQRCAISAQPGRQHPPPVPLIGAGKGEESL